MERVRNILKSDIIFARIYDFEFELQALKKDWRNTKLNSHQILEPTVPQTLF